MKKNQTIDKQGMFLGAPPIIFKRAGQLRQRETKAEQLLWSKLRGKRLGVKFRRQHPIFSYIADFYCHTYKLVIELDGPIHQTKEAREYDNSRSQVLREFKIDIIRFTNDQVLNDIDAVLEKIRDRLVA